MEWNADQVRMMLAAGQIDDLREGLSKLYAADIAELLEQLEEPDRKDVFDLLDPQAKGELIHEAGVFVAQDLIDGTSTMAMASAIEQLPADDLVEILDDLAPDLRTRLLARMETSAAEGAKRKLQAYDEETAGRLMSEKVVRVQLRWTVDETIGHLRNVDPETETFAHLYAVNARDMLVGLIRLRHLLVAPPSTLLADLVEPNTISVKATDDQEAVAQTMSKYNFSALPVLDDDGKLVGVVTHDDVLDVLEEEATEDIHRLGGSSPLDEPYLLAPPKTVAAKRIGWLLLLLLTALLTYYVQSLFKDQLTNTQLVTLMLFVPALIGTGGNAGSQTTSMVIRALAVGDIETKDAFWVLLKELRTGLMLGLVMATVGAGIASLLHGGRIALIVGVAAGVIVVWATTVGSMLPLIAAKLELDPTVVSGPMMSTLVDAAGLFIYFSIARVILTYPV